MEIQRDDRAACPNLNQQLRPTVTPKPVPGLSPHYLSLELFLGLVLEGPCTQKIILFEFRWGERLWGGAQVR